MDPAARRSCSASSLDADQPRGHAAAGHPGPPAARPRAGPRRRCSWSGGCRTTTACARSRVAALGSLLALCAVERALVTRRLLPLCLGLLTAAFDPRGHTDRADRGRRRSWSRRVRCSSWCGRVRGSGWAGARAVAGPGSSCSSSCSPTRRSPRCWRRPGCGRGRPEPVLVRGTLALRAAVPDDRGRLADAPVPGAAADAVHRHLPGRPAAPRPDPRCRAGTGPAADRHRRAVFLLLALTPTKWTHHFGCVRRGRVRRWPRSPRSPRARGAAVEAQPGRVHGTGCWWWRRWRRPGRTPTGACPPSACRGRIRHRRRTASACRAALLVAAADRRGDRVRGERAGRSDRGGLRRPQERRPRALKLGSDVAGRGLRRGRRRSSSPAWARRSEKQSEQLQPRRGERRQHLLGSGCNLSDSVMVERDPASSVLSRFRRPAAATVGEAVESTAGPAAGRRGQRTSAGGFHPTPSQRRGSAGQAAARVHHRRTVPMWSSYRRGERTGILRTGWFTSARR